ncbi:hypothetical protein QBC43DRAFT_289373 [Cladorrhinum sp. PSN259]|nr:hypothetical protein QBC43DRAFT_289373 [Cladorrhinum sp. PSN259]
MRTRRNFHWRCRKCRSNIIEAATGNPKYHEDVARCKDFIMTGSCPEMFVAWVPGDLFVSESDCVWCTPPPAAGTDAASVSGSGSGSGEVYGSAASDAFYGDAASDFGTPPSAGGSVCQSHSAGGGTAPSDSSEGNGGNTHGGGISPSDSGSGRSYWRKQKSYW